ncbi:hypothetical protein [Microbacterium sp. 77mftsu3.1]|uniref:hypothetical protein n=1 Tax=Microbacterium sp. 77mftsu3.1 TaxID=1761802 RepID=UPI00036E8887|nr:hypothetical protein [Microbacterium sp. 77mftsu3.1]SDH42124.1 hypothetical protein SAMN04488590_3298 [Microbacterium sp. 77mftsu3.1]
MTNNLEPFTHLRLPIGDGKSLSTWTREHPGPLSVDIAPHVPGDEPGVQGVVVWADRFYVYNYSFVGEATRAAITAEVNEYNADPETGWKRLLAGLARAAVTMNAMEAKKVVDRAFHAIGHLSLHDPFTLLSIHHEDVPVLRWQPDFTVTGIEGSIVGQRHSYRVRFGNGKKVTVYSEVLDPADTDLELIQHEVARFKADPQASFDAMLTRAFHADYIGSAGALAAAAAEMTRAADALKRVRREAQPKPIGVPYVFKD